MRYDHELCLNTLEMNGYALTTFEKYYFDFACFDLNSYDSKKICDSLKCYFPSESC